MRSLKSPCGTSYVVNITIPISCYTFSENRIFVYAFWRETVGTGGHQLGPVGPVFTPRRELLRPHW